MSDIDNVFSILCPRCRKERDWQIRRISPNEGIDIGRFCKKCRERVHRRIDSLIGKALYNN